MGKLKSIEEVYALRDKVKSKVKIREQGERIEELITVTVYMGQSGYKAGAKEILNHFIDTLAKHEAANVVVLQADSSGLGAFEPLVGVAFPGQGAVLFGKVDYSKADEIIEEYIIKGKSIDGILSLTTGKRN